MKHFKMSDLLQGNPGAVNVTSQILRFKDQQEILTWLLENGHTGGKLWSLYKDVYGEDIWAMVRAIRTDLDNQTMKKIGMPCPGYLV